MSMFFDDLLSKTYVAVLLQSDGKLAHGGLVAGARFLTSTVLVAEIGKAPHVPHADGERESRHDEIQLSRPRLSVCRRRGTAGFLLIVIVECMCTVNDYVTVQGFFLSEQNFEMLIRNYHA